MTTFSRLEDVILDEQFPEADLALRHGKHIDADDVALYTYLVDAQEHLEPFYRRYGCELVHRSDGYFYLLPTSDRLGRRHLSAGEMLVGQALTLLYLDPATLQQGGIVTREQVLAQLAGVMGSDSLIAALNPKRKRLDERVAQETVRSKVSEAIRRLAGLGFVDLVEDNRIRLRRTLLRFAEPVRGTQAPQVALQRLVAEGELVLTEADEGESETATDDGEPTEGTVETVGGANNAPEELAHAATGQDGATDGPPEVPEPPPDFDLGTPPVPEPPPDFDLGTPPVPEPPPDFDLETPPVPEPPPDFDLGTPPVPEPPPDFDLGTPPVPEPAPHFELEPTPPEGEAPGGTKRDVH